jgi:hypothetical protein
LANHKGRDPNKQKAVIESIVSGNAVNEADSRAEAALRGMLGGMAAYSGKKAKWEDLLRSREAWVRRWTVTNLPEHPPMTSLQRGKYPIQKGHRAGSAARLRRSRDPGPEVLHVAFAP